MKELEFRVWLHNRGYMETAHFDDGKWVSTDGIFSLKVGENDFIEPYTGLKDKNGKKIYVGDIVKIARSYGYGFLPKGAKAKIEFDEKELCYKLRGQGEFRLTAKKELEVIGNIHENPELLEKKK